VPGQQAAYRGRVMPPPKWVQNERSLRDVRKDSEIDEFSKQVRADSLGPSVIAAPPYVPVEPTSPAPWHVGGSSPGKAEPPPSESPTVEDPPLERFFGKFEGEVKFDDGKIWQMGFSLTGKVEEKHLVGESTVSLSSDGKIISKVSQTGELTLIKKPAEGSIGILLTPTTTYAFQLYYVKDRDLLVGNYYAQKEPGKLVPLGAVRLVRKSGGPRPVSKPVSRSRPDRRLSEEWS
jgi:hypothetical protein